MASSTPTLLPPPKTLSPDEDEVPALGPGVKGERHHFKTNLDVSLIELPEELKSMPHDHLREIVHGILPNRPEGVKELRVDADFEWETLWLRCLRPTLAATPLSTCVRYSVFDPALADTFLLTCGGTPPAVDYKWIDIACHGPDFDLDEKTGEPIYHTTMTPDQITLFKKYGRDDQDIDQTLMVARAVHMKGGFHRMVLVAKDAFQMKIPLIECPGRPEFPSKEIMVAAVVLPMPGDDAVTPVILTMLPVVMQCLLHHLMAHHKISASSSMTEQEREQVAVVEWCWRPTHPNRQDIVDRLFFARLAPLSAADHVVIERRIITPLSMMDAPPGQVMAREKQERGNRERRAVLEAKKKKQEEEDKKTPLQ